MADFGMQMMSVFTPLGAVLCVWLLLSGVGFVPIEVVGRLKVVNVIDLLVLLSFVLCFVFLNAGRGTSPCSKRLSFAFFLYTASWLCGVLFSNRIYDSLERFLLWFILAASIQLAFLLPKPKVDLFVRGWGWGGAIWVISLVLISSFFLIGPTDYGRVTLPWFEQGALVYRYVENVGLLPDPNVLSYGLVFLFFLSLRNVGLKLPTLGVLITALVLVGSRSALLAFFVAFFYWILCASPRTFLFLCGGGAVAFLGLSLIGVLQVGIIERFQNIDNYLGRVELLNVVVDGYFSSGLGMIFGSGFGSARFIGDPHNLYLSVLYDGGLLAIFFLIYVYYAAFKYVGSELYGFSKISANAMLVFNIIIGFFYWQDQMFFVPFFCIWFFSIYKTNSFRNEIPVSHLGKVVG